MSSSPTVSCLYRLGDAIKALECIDLSGTTKVSFGRHASNDVCLLESAAVSRHHAVLSRIPEGWTVTDQGSSNGVWVDGQRIPTRHPCPLPDRSLLEIGKDPKTPGPAAYCFRFHQAAKVRRTSGDTAEEDKENTGTSLPPPRRVTRLSLRKSRAAEVPNMPPAVGSPSVKIHRRLSMQGTQLRLDMEKRCRSADEKIQKLQEMLLLKEEQLEAQQDLLLTKEEQLEANETTCKDGKQLVKKLQTTERMLESQTKAVAEERAAMLALLEESEKEKEKQQQEANQQVQQCKQLEAAKCQAEKALHTLRKELQVAQSTQGKLATEKEQIMAHLNQEKQRLEDNKARYEAEQLTLRSKLNQLQATQEENVTNLHKKEKELRFEKLKVEATLREQMEKQLAMQDATYKAELIKQRESLEEKLAENAEEQTTLRAELAQMQEEVALERARREESNELQDKMEDVLDTELMCSICAELFIQAVSLNCSHSFCQLCLSKWRAQKEDCPVCRTKITSSVRSIVLDNYITRVVTFLSRDLQDARAAVLEERNGETQEWERTQNQKKLEAAARAQNTAAGTNQQRQRPQQQAQPQQQRGQQQRARQSRFRDHSPNWQELYLANNQQQQGQGQHQQWQGQQQQGQGQQQQWNQPQQWYNHQGNQQYHRNPFATQQQTNWYYNTYHGNSYY